MQFDVVSVRQILANLLDNAIKYNAIGGRVTVKNFQQAQRLQVRVGNAGQGIAPEAQQHLFERFFRERQHEDVPGAGLGLSLARELARGQGGELRLVASSPQWTEFELELSTAGGQP